MLESAVGSVYETQLQTATARFEGYQYVRGFDYWFPHLSNVLLPLATQHNTSAVKRAQGILLQRGDVIGSEIDGHRPCRLVNMLQLLLEPDGGIFDGMVYYQRHGPVDEASSMEMCEVRNRVLKIDAWLFLACQTPFASWPPQPLRTALASMQPCRICDLCSSGQADLGSHGNVR